MDRMVDALAGGSFARTGSMPARTATSGPTGSPAVPIGTHGAAGGVLTVDVFDTILLRRPMAGIRRDRDAALRWRRDANPRTVARVRACATRALYRAMERVDGTGDVPFDLIARLSIEALGDVADTAAIERFTEAEIAMEVAALLPNRALLARLGRERQARARVVAISDTPHSAGTIGRIIHAVVGDDVPLDAIHTSADHGLTKRDGHLFRAVADAEGFEPSDARHLGDDALADGVRARESGLTAAVVPRSGPHHLRRKLDGLRAGRAPYRRMAPHAAAGTVVADGIYRLWMQLRAMELAARRRGEPVPVALFCARGGLVMRACLDRFLERTGLPLGVDRRDLMVSRIVAIRPALLAGSDVAFAECAREFRRETFGMALQALGGEGAFVPGIDPDDPFSAGALRAALEAERGAGLRARMTEQAARFAAHLDATAPDGRPVVLVDTGLFGSTFRLLADAYPGRDWRSVLLARANYKGFDASHFPRLTGLWSERDRYAPHDVRSTVLRYWQWVEDIFEPALPSVADFDAAGLSTIERADPAWCEHLLDRPKPVLRAALDRIDALDPTSLPLLAEEAEGAWRSVRRTLIAPTRREAELFAVRGRSRDFGLAGTVEAFGGAGDAGRLGWLRSARWKEGAVAWRHPRVRRPVQWAIEAMHAARWARSALRRSPR